MAPSLGGADQLKDALAGISGRHRAVIYQSYYLGWTTARIAADLGIDDDTAKGELHDALCALRAGLRRAADLTRSPAPSSPTGSGPSAVRRWPA